MVAPFVVGGLIYELIYGSDKKRDLTNGAEVSATLFQFNQSALRGQDLERLHGIVMTMGPTKDTVSPVWSGDRPRRVGVACCVPTPGGFLSPPPRNNC